MNSLPLIMMTLFAIGIGLLSTWYETNNYNILKKYIEKKQIVMSKKELWEFMLKKNMSEVLLFIIGLGFGYMLAVFS